MIDKKEFTAIRREFAKCEEKREKLIALSRDIIRISKFLIYSLHRKDIPNAKKLVKQITAKMKVLPKEDYDTGIRKVAVQEYVEAITFFDFVTKGRLTSAKSLGVESGDYLLGLCDLTGELVRYAVNSIISGRYSDAEKAKSLVSELYEEFLKFNLRNGELRKKSDAIKWNLNKLEDLEYDTKIKRKNLHI